MERSKNSTKKFMLVVGFKEQLWHYAGTMLALCWHYAGTMLALCWHYAGTMLALWLAKSGKKPEKPLPV
jgi:hypothetical protein